MQDTETHSEQMFLKKIMPKDAFAEWYQKPSTNLAKIFNEYSYTK